MITTAVAQWQRMREQGLAALAGGQPSVATASSDPSGLVLDFGKYRGKLLSTVYEHDPEYVQWLAREARELAVKEAAQVLVNQGQEELPF